MSPNRRHLLKGGALLASPLIVSRRAWADALPPGPIRIYCPYPAGDATDLVCRIVGESIRQDLRRDVIVENRAGGAGLIGVTAMVNSPPDGLTIGFVGSQHVTLQTLYRRFALLRQTEPISRMTSGAFSIVVAPGSRFRTLDELFTAMVEKPATITYGSGGIGTPAHFCMELLRGRIAGFEPVHVPFKAASESAAAAAGGQIDCAVGISATMFPLVTAGRLRALAVTSSRRAEALPDVPTLAEQRVPGFTHTAWGGFAAPKGTPPAAVLALHELLRSAARKPELPKFMASSSGIVDLSASSEKFAAELQAEIDAETQMIKERNIQPVT